MEINLKIGPYTLLRRTTYSKLQVLDKNENIITNSSIGIKIINDYNDQLKNKNKYFWIDENRLIHYTIPNDIKFLFIPDEVTSITNTALENGKFDYIHLPNLLKCVGDHAFVNCCNLKEICFSPFIEKFGGGIFTSCVKLQNVSLPLTLNKIPKFSFSDCVSLTKINLPENISIVEQDTFNKCSSLSDIFLPDTISEIGDYAFCDCNKLEKINIPKNLSIFGAHCFAGSGLKELVFNYSLSKRDANYYGDFLTYTKINTITINRTVEFMDPAFFDKIKKQIKEINFLGTDKEFKTFSKNNRDLFKLLNCSTINVVDDNIDNQINNNKTNYIDKLKKSVNAR